YVLVTSVLLWWLLHGYARRTRVILDDALASRDALAIAAEQMTTLLERSASMICSVDVNARCHTISGATTQILGLPRLVFEQQSLLDRSAPEDRHAFARMLQDAGSKHQDRESEVSMIRADGSLVPVAWTA